MVGVQTKAGLHFSSRWILALGKASHYQKRKISQRPAGNVEIPPRKDKIETEAP